MNIVAETSSAEELRAVLGDPDRIRRLSFDELLLASEVGVRAGALDIGIAAMTAATDRPDAESSTYLRLAEFLHREGRSERALTAAKEALFRAPDDEDCRTYVLELLAAAGDYAGAVEFAEPLRTTGRDRRHPLGLKVVSLLIGADRLEDAFAEIQAYNDLGEPDEAGLLMEAEIAFRLGRPHVALANAERAVRIWPGSIPAMRFYANLLFERQEFARAALTLERAREISPDDPTLARMHAAAMLRAGATKGALRVALAAIKLAPSECENWFVAAMMASSLGYAHEACELLGKAIEIAPDRLSLYFDLAHMLVQRGLFDEAIGVLDDAQRVVPSDLAVRDLRLHFLERRKDLRSPVTRAIGPQRALPLSRDTDARRRVPESDGAELFRRIQIQVRVIAALVLRGIRTQAVDSRFGVLSLLVPPAIQIAMIGIVMSFFNQGQPPIGDRLFFFYATGLLPFYLFLHMVEHSLEVFANNTSVLQTPLIKRLDLVIAVALTELSIGAMTVVIVFGAFWIFSYGPHSDNHIQAVAAYLATAVFGFGFGLIFAVLNNLNRVWIHVWTALQRTLYVLSGVFFIPQQMPDWLRGPLIWNPLLQCVEWFRTGFFSLYNPPWIDKAYVLGAGFATVLVGLALESALRHKMKLQ